MSSTITFSRSVQVQYDVDICIAGGGPAGIAAAIAASRNGASVFLGEACGCFGGLGTSGLVPAFCGVGNGRDFLGGPICREVLDRIQAPPGELEREFTFINVENLKRTYDEMMEKSGALYALDVRLIDVVKDESGRLTEAIFSDDSDRGLFAVRAKVFIDATGNGDLAAWAGAQYEQGNDRGVPMPSTLCTLWNDVNWDEYHAAHPNIERLLFTAIDDGMFTVHDYHHSGMFHVGTCRAGGNFTHSFSLRANDHASKTRGWLELRQRVQEYQAFYRKYVPGFQNAELAVTASQLGIRECRRILGEYRMTLEDFRNRASFQDEIGRFAYPVDIHPLDDSMEEFQRFKRDFLSNLRYGYGESYGIPYRALLPKGTVNILTAGRCISADQPMAASVRVMPGCFLTGQAAGCAAAIAALNHDGILRSVDIQTLRKSIAGL